MSDKLYEWINLNELTRDQLITIIYELDSLITEYSSEDIEDRLLEILK